PADEPVAELRARDRTQCEREQERAHRDAVHGSAAVEHRRDPMIRPCEGRGRNRPLRAHRGRERFLYREPGAAITEPQKPIIISSHVWSPHFTSFVGSGLYLLPGELS